MVQKALKVILVISIAINIILGFILSTKHKQVNTNVYVDKIDSLELEISKLQEVKDSVKEVIDTIIIEINKNNKTYEENRNVILSNSVSDDYLFFTEYLRWNRRRDSINNN